MALSIITLNTTDNGVTSRNTINSNFAAILASYPTSAIVVGTTDIQTLTNKTLTSPILTSPTINMGSDTNGDIYQRVAGVLTRLPIGSSGQVPTVVSGILAYASPSSTNGNYITDTGAANAYVATLSPALAAYTAGTLVQFKATNANTTASTVNVNGLGVKTIKKLNGTTDLSSGDIAAGMVVSLEYDGTNFVMLNPAATTPTSSSIKFGGDGSDGALTITSGTTNIDLASSAFVVKNYSSISITGTGKLTFTNPAANGTVIVLKSQGNVTLTSSQTPMIDVSSLGAAGGIGVTSTSVTAGNIGNNGISTVISTGGGSPSSGNAVGAGGTLAAMFFGGFNFTTTRQKYSTLPIASGGGSAGVAPASGNATSGNGGRGGGTLVIECAGAWNFTTASGISVAGQVGGNGSVSAVGNAGGSGGGAGGYFLGLYNILTANSGTVTVTAGTGGLKDPTTPGGNGYGAGGGALLVAGSAGTVSATGSTKTGGDGATGVSTIIANTDF